MKNRFSLMLNTTSAILFSVACNGVLFSYLLLSNMQSEIYTVSSEVHTIENFSESKNHFQTEFKNQDTIDKFNFINATIEKNQKFNQELKNFISQSERAVFVSH